LTGLDGPVPQRQLGLVLVPPDGLKPVVAQDVEQVLPRGPGRVDPKHPSGCGVQGGHALALDQDDALGEMVPPWRGAQPPPPIRYPRPLAVSTIPSPSLLLSCATCWSTVLSPPGKSRPHTLSRSAPREKTLPGFAAMKARRSNSRLVRSTRTPSLLTSAALTSMETSPTSWTSRRFSRLDTARSRATSSAALNGFVIQSSAPASRPPTRSASPARAVSMSTGRGARSGCDLTRLRSASPLSPGSIRSSTR